MHLWLPMLAGLTALSLLVPALGVILVSALLSLQLLVPTTALSAGPRVAVVMLMLPAALLTGRTLRAYRAALVREAGR